MINILGFILPLVVFLPIPGLAFRLGSTLLFVGLLALSFVSKWLERIRGVLVILSIVAVVRLPTFLLDLEYPYHAIAIFILLALYYLIFRRKLLWRLFKYPQKGWFKFFCIYTLLSMTALLVWSHFTVDYTPPVNLDNIRPLSLVAIGIIFVLFNALYEELLFRGCLTTELMKFGNIRPVLVIQACAFAMMHFPNGFPNQLVGVVLTFIYAIFMGHLFIRSRSLWPCIVSHLCCDSIVFMLIVMKY